MVLFFKILKRTFKKVPMNSTRIFGHILISHLIHFPSGKRRQSIRLLFIRISYYTYDVCWTVLFQILLYYPELMFPVLVVKLIGSPLLDLSTDFFVRDFGISLEI